MSNKEREREAPKAKEGSNSYAPSKVAKEWRNIPFFVIENVPA